MTLLETHRTRRLDAAVAALGSLPFVAALLVALNGLYIALVAFGNITDFSANRRSCSTCWRWTRRTSALRPEPASTRA